MGRIRRDLGSPVERTEGLAGLEARGRRREPKRNAPKGELTLS